MSDMETGELKITPQEGQWWLGKDNDGATCVRVYSASEQLWYHLFLDGHFIDLDSEFSPLMPMVTVIDNIDEPKEPKDGECWVCSFTRFGGLSSERALFFKEYSPTSGESWFADSERNTKVDGILVKPLYKMHSSESVKLLKDIISTRDNELVEHRGTITKITQGLDALKELCESHGLGDRPMVDAVTIIKQLDKRLSMLGDIPRQEVHPLIEGAFYMCVFKYKDSSVKSALFWRDGGFFYGSEPLSQSENKIDVLYQLGQKEQVIEQYEDFPPIDSVRFMRPNSEPKNGKPGFKTDNPGIMVRVSSHFTDHRGVKLLAYVSDDAPFTGGVCIPGALETEFEKKERERDEFLNKVSDELGIAIDSSNRDLLTAMYEKGYNNEK